MIDSDQSDSAACLMHQLVDGHVVDPATVRDVGRFRQGERKRLYALRKRVPVERRSILSTVVAQRLEQELGDVAGKVVAVYWPIRHELDLRGWMKSIALRGASVVLPVVVEHNTPLQFRSWTPGCQMCKGLWDIPVPKDGDVMIPDVVVAPLLGVDENRYRLGNGGGYYDGTLARLSSQTMVVGVGHGWCRMPTIFPMPWDVPMHHIVLSDGSVF